MAILLAGLRGIDAELWKAARIDAIPPWRVYMSIILPMLMPMLVTASVLLAVAVVKLYDLVVAMTKGGPGLSSEVPAKFIMDNFFERSNVGLGVGRRDRSARHGASRSSRRGSTPNICVRSRSGR